MSRSGGEVFATSNFFSGYERGTAGTIMELRWPSQTKAVVLNTYEFEYILMPNTELKVLARRDDVEFPDGLKAKRYYVLEIQDPR